jgi:PKD domain/Pectate lyase superfamily protein
MRDETAVPTPRPFVRRALLLGSLALIALSAAPAAHAAVYCVDYTSCPPGGISQPGLQEAFNAAAMAVAPDTIYLGPGAYSHAGGYAAVNGDPVELIGSGRGATAVTMPPGAAPGSAVLDLSNSSNASASDLRVEIPAGFNYRGLFIAKTVKRVDVAGAEGLTAGQGLRTSTAPTVEDSTVDLPLDPSNLGFYQTNGAATVTGLTISAGNGIQTGSTQNSTFRDIRIRAGQVGASLGGIGSGTLTLRNWQVEMVGDVQDAAIVLYPPIASAESFDLRHVTLKGSANQGGDSTGLRVGATQSGSSASAQVESTIIRGFDHSLERGALGGASASLAIGHSNFDPATLDQSGPGGPIALGTGNVNGDPLFVDPAAGDLRLRGGSPSIDAGASPAMIAADLGGLPRTRDGNADGVAVPDQGAREYQPHPPALVVTVQPGSPQAGAVASFDATGSSDPDPGEPLAYSWSFSDGSTATGAKVEKAFAAEGPAMATVTARDPAGFEATKTVSFTVGPAADLVRPLIEGAAFGPRRFAVARMAARVRRGSTLRFRLSEAADLVLTIQRARPGRRSHGKCRKPSRRLAHARRCTRWTRAGRLTRQGLGAGPNAIGFSGRIGRRALAPGSYRVLLVAFDQAGNRSLPATAPFRIVKR